MSYFVETPIWAYVILTGLGLIFVTAFFVTKRVVYLWAVPILLAIAGLFFLLDYLVETDREQVERKTAELARDATEGNLAHMETLFSNRFYYSGLGGKAAIMAQARRYVPAGQQRAVEVWGMETKVSSSKKTMIVQCNGKAAGHFSTIHIDPPFLGLLELTYVKDEDGQWRISGIRITDMQGNDKGLSP
jgi:uncharacterized membrane protein YeiB